MKKLLYFFLLFAVCTTALAQNPSYRQKLYYTCKVWGFVKYFHSRVSDCQVNWDSVLVSSLPLIKNAATNNDFNDVLYQMLQAAGPMELATSDSPYNLPLELKRNINFGWFEDAVFRDDVRFILDTIKNNFRPQTICWVNYGNQSYLAFPHDDPIIDSNFSTNYPNEFIRLSCIFKYWNIINYLNPNNYIQDTPWDSTLYNNILSIATASNYPDFYKTFKKMVANLKDPHAEGLTWSSSNSSQYYAPNLVLKYIQDNYVVVKSTLSEIHIGDIITSIDGKTTTEWEDSLSQYISAGNPAVFRREMCIDILCGTSGSPIHIGYKDSLGNEQSLSTYRYNYVYGSWFTFYPSKTLATTKWTKWDCNVGYVNMGILEETDVNAMFSDLQYTSAIIFDIRNYPNGTAWPIANLIYPNNLCFAKLTEPDITFPGTYYWDNDYLGYNNPSYYDGKVIILCNQETQSSAEYSCMILKAMPNSIIVGSQTAGADGDVTYFNLSQDIQTGFTTLGVYYPDGTQTQRIGIVPDSVVNPTIEGIRQGRDEVLEKALEIAGCDMSGVSDNLNKPNNNFSINPNPANDILRLALAESFFSCNIEIFNVLGEKVWQGNASQLKMFIDVTSLSIGVYFLRVGNETKMFVKE